MKSFKDWSISNKLILPLFAVMVLGGGGIIWALLEMHDEIVNDALPEERALDGIRRASFELLSEYYELMLGHSETLERDIEALKEELEVYEVAFEAVAGAEEFEAGFVEAIDAAEQKLRRIGDETVAARFRLLDHMEAMEAFEAPIEHLLAERPAGAEPVEDRQVPELDELVEEYISEIREYVLGPNDTTRREIAEIERYLEGILRAHDEGASAHGDQGQDADKFEPVRQLLEAGRFGIVLTTEFQTKRDDLEAIHDELLMVLDEAGSFVAHETDKAFETGFASVAGVSLAVLIMITLVGYEVTQKIAKSVTALTKAVDRFGGGDLNARADVGGEDEIGGMATAFNHMATSLKLNIAQRERAENAFKDFAESASDWFWEMDADQGFTYVSGRFFEVFDLPWEAVIGKKWEDLIGAEQIAADWAKWCHHFDDLEARRPIRDFDYAIVGEDGATRYIRVSGLPRFDDAGKFLGYRGSGADVTEQRRIEEELRQAHKLEALGRLSGGIAHDFNNILLPIITITEVIRDDVAQDKRLTANLDKVLMAAQRGRSLIEKVLKFSRRQPMDRRPVDLAEVVEEALALVSAAVPATIEVRSEFEPGLGKVLADGTQIHEVLMNLASNAAQSIGMKNGLIETTLRKVRIDDSDFDQLAELQSGPYARLTVSDTGSGMDAKTMAQIFDPFFTTKSVGEGTGLGLAAVHGIVTEHGGAITVSSEPERGTTFAIYLPLLESGEAKPDDSTTRWPLTGS